MIKILYVDLRDGKSHFYKYTCEWQENMIIRDSMDAGMPQELVQQIANDLENDNRKMMVSWIDNVTHDHSEIGGAGNLEMITTPNFIITITYEDEFTSNKQIDDSSEWMLANY